MKIIIVIAYYNRKQILNCTLNSIKKSKYWDNCNIIIVDDASDEIHKINDLNSDKIKVVEIEKNKKTWVNPCIPYNIGFNEIQNNTDIVIIQNPESYHAGDILAYISKNINDSKYFSFSCFSLTKVNTDKLLKNESIKETKNNNAFDLRNNNWFNHSIYNPTGYHFCSALTYNNLKKLHGFNEKFGNGIAFDDNEFLYRAEKIMTKNIIDEPYVYHLWHYDLVDTDATVTSNPEKRLLWEKNKNLFEEYKNNNCIINNTIFN